MHHTGIELHLGKTKFWNKAGKEPQGVRTPFAKEVWDKEKPWLGDRSLPAKEQGVVILGTPLGTADFVKARGADRLKDEESFRKTLLKLPDLQSS